MHPGEFHDYDVEAYEAVEEYAGPFDSIYYMGSGIDRTPSETFETDDILHADHDPAAVEFLSGRGLEAREVDVTEYRHGRDFELVLISHLTSDTPVIDVNLADDGSVLCSTKMRAKKIHENLDLDLDAIYTGEVEEFEYGTVPEADMYLFR